MIQDLHRAVGAAYDGPLFSPSNTEAEMKAVDNAIGSIERALVKSVVPEDMKAGWQAFRNEWLAFRRDNSDLLSRSLNQTYATAMEFRDRVNDWRKQLIGAGMNVQEPALASPNKEFGKDKGIIDRVSTGLKTVAVLGVVGAGAWYLLKRKFSKA